MYQSIKPTVKQQKLDKNVAELSSTVGEINNKICWEFNEANKVISGDLVVKSTYEVTSKGELSVSLQEHLLLPHDDPPTDVEEFIMSTQRTIPFESFDPDETVVKTTVR